MSLFVSFLRSQVQQLMLLVFFFFLIDLTFAQQGTQNRYYVGAIQRYSSWGECSSGSDPNFVKTIVSFKTYQNNILVLNQLNDLRKFNTQEFSKAKVLQDEFGDFQVIVKSEYILNDNSLDLKLEASRLKFGKNVVSGSASDPCSNNWNWSGDREGYYASTEIYIDDPVHITCPQVDLNKRVILKDNQYVRLVVGDFYENGKESSRLYVKCDGISKHLEKVTVRPNTELWLTYNDIFGSDISKYGEDLEFWVEKRLLNNEITWGSKVNNVTFYPRGIPFKVESVVPSACSNGQVNLFIRPDNPSDISLIQPNVYKCSVTGQGGAYAFNCEIIPDVNNEGKCRLNISDTDVAKIKPNHTLLVRLFNIKNTNQYYTEAECTFPAIPDYVTVNQKKGYYNIGGYNYDVPNQDLFLLLQVNDSYNRYKYDLKIDGTPIGSIGNLPVSYEQMSAEDKATIDASFNNYFDNLIKQPDNPYRTFLKTKLQTWAKTVEAKVPVELYKGANPVFLPNNKEFLFLSGDTIYRGNINGGTPMPLIVKKGINDFVVHTNGLCFFYSNTEVSKQNIYRVVFENLNAEEPILKSGYYPTKLEVGNDRNIYFMSQGSLYRIPLNTAANVTPSLILQRISDIRYATNSDGDYVITYEHYKACSDLSKYGYFYTEREYSGGGGAVKSPKNQKVQQVGSESLEESVYANYFGGGSELVSYLNRVDKTIIDEYNSEAGNFIFAPNGSFILADDLGGMIKIPIANPWQATSLLEGSNPFYIFNNSFNFFYLGNDNKVHKSCVDDCDSYESFPNLGYSSFTVNDLEDCYLFTKLSKIYANFTYESQIVDYYLNRLYPNKGIAYDWYVEYRNQEEDNWKKLYSLIKVENPIIKKDETQNLTLIDRDGCSSTIPIKVTPPPLLDFKIDTTKTTNPCTADGTAKITYLGGGNPPYIIGGVSLDQVNKSVLLQNLQAKKHEMFLHDNYLLSFTIDAKNGFTSQAIDNTCQSQNGKITFDVAGVSGIRTYTLYKDGSAIPSQTIANTDKSSGEFSGLGSGIYTIKLSQAGGCNFEKPNIVVVDDIFNSKGDIIVNNPDEIAKTGSVTVNFENRDGVVDWKITRANSNVPLYSSQASQNSVSQDNLGLGEYTFHATYNNCTVSKNFIIAGPEILSVVKLEQVNGSLFIDTKIGSIKGISDFTLMLNKNGSVLQKSTTKDYLLDTLKGSSSIGEYSIVLNYGKDPIKSFVIHKFNYPLNEINNEYSTTKPTCFGGIGKVKITPTGGIEGSIIEASANDLPIPINTNIDVGNKYTYSLLSKLNSEIHYLTSTVTLKESVLDTYTINIPQPTPVSAIVVPINVTCADKNDGKVYIKDMQGGNGVYEYLVSNDNVWKNSSLKTLGLGPGKYKVDVRDGNECRIEYPVEVTIKQPQPLVVEKQTVTQPTCERKNGAVSVEVKGGNGAFKYEWKYNGKSVSKTEDFSVDTIFSLPDTLNYGSYTLRVEDIERCTLPNEILSISLDQYYNPSVVTAIPEPVRCYGEANGLINIQTTGGTNSISKFYITKSDNSYKDSIQGGNKQFANLRSGMYYLTAKDNIGCVSNSSFDVEVIQPSSPLNVNLGLINPVIGKGTSTGTIKATVSGGNPGVKSVELFDSEKTSVFSSNKSNNPEFIIGSLKADKYKVFATDLKGCNASDSLFVIEPDSPLSLIFKNTKNALCKAQTGSFEVEASGGWGDYTFKREGYNTYFKADSFENLNAGSYRVTVKDKLGATFSNTVTISEPTELRSLVSGFKLPTCSNNGEIDLLVNGGTPPYQVFDSINTKPYKPVLSNTPLAITGLAANSYIMRVTDSNGCIYDVETSLDNGQLLNVNFNNLIYPSGKGMSDGSIDALVSGGNASYTFQWKKRFGSVVLGTTSSLNNISAGHYELTVTESGGCSDTSYVYLPGIDEYPFTLSKVRHETSYLGKNGFAKLTSEFKNWKEFEVIKPNNEYKQFNYGDTDGMFSYQNDTLYLSGLEGGEYFVSGVTNDNDRVYAKFTITPYQKFIVKRPVVKNVNRKGDYDGRIAITVEGGGGGNTFHWTQISGASNGTLQPKNSAEGSVLGNVFAGEYRCSVTDCYGNTRSENVNVLEPTFPLQVVVDKHSNETCKDSTNAFVELKAIGGWGHYQFKEENIGAYSNSSLYGKLGVGNHTFSIIDKQGVTESVTAKITEPDYLRSRVAVVDSVKCKNDNNGRVEFLVEGGTAPYRLTDNLLPYVLGNDTIVRGLPEGKYIFDFTDSNNCPVLETVPVEIYAPDSLLFSKIDVTHTTCNTDNGKINVELKGGTKPYRYQWLDSNDQIIDTTNSLSSLVQNGLYRLKVVDRNKCPQNFSQRINHSVNPYITNIDTTAVLCYGGSTGSALVKSVKAGLPYAPYAFKWSNGDSDTISKGYKKGIYSVTVTDTNKCSTVSYFEIIQPDSLRISITDRKNAQCFGYNDAFLLAQGFGGVGNYNYLWSTGATTNRIENLFQGDYRLSIMDANLCETVDTFTIIEPDMLEVDLGEDIKMCPGNSRVIDGQEFANHEWSTSGGVISSERYLTIRDANNYFLKVTDDEGCFAYDTIGLSIGNDALKADFLMSSQAELGDTISIYELSNMEIDSVSWYYNNDAFIEVDNKIGLDYAFFLKSLKTGIYNIELSAFSGGCISTTAKQIEIVDDSGENPDDDDLGYKDPLIKSFSVNPNPNDGNFYAVVKLREISNINLVLFSVASGLKMDERFENQLSEYSVGYNLSNLNSGVYLLILKAGNERKQVKIIIQ